jgi:hypothetical protein
MPEWDKAKESMSIEIKAISKTIPGYDYSTEARAEATDGKICAFMIEGIREAKDKMFNIIQSAYELHEESLNKNFEGLRDDLDIFSDEIKIRNFEWGRDLTQEWVERLVRHDYHLIQQLDRLNRELDDLNRLFLRIVRLYPNETNPEHLEKIRMLLKLLEDAVDHLVLTFKEREVICNLKPISLERTYQQMQDYYRRLL